MKLFSLVRTNLLRPQYRLRSLFVLVAVASIPLAIWASREHQYRARRCALKVLGAQGCMVSVIRQDGSSASLAFLSDPSELRPNDLVSGVHLGPGRISDLVIAAAMRFPKSTHLGLRRSEITREQLCDLAKLPLIEGIDFEQSNISDSTLLCFLGGLSAIRTLNLSSTNVTGVGLSNLHSLRRLQELDASGSYFTDEGLRRLGELSSLKVLTLAQTRVTGVGFDSFRDMPKLERLDLWQTGLTDTGARCLARCTSLRILILDSTKISGEALAHLSGLPQLEELFVCWNSIGDDSLRYLGGRRRINGRSKTLERFSCLKSVDLRGCPVTESGVRQLQRMRPDLKIGWDGHATTQGHTYGGAKNRDTSNL